MAKLVISRLNKPDAELNGWVLNNFPETVKQVHLLQEASKVPKIIC